MSRLACLVLAAPLLGGCGALIGIDDPVAEFQVSPEIGGHYLVKLQDQNDFFVEFHVELGATPEAREVYTIWQALDGTDGAGDPRSPQGAPFELDTIILTNTAEFEFETTSFDVSYLGTAGEDVQLDADLSGRFPIRDGDDAASVDAFCGEIDGAYLSPTEGQPLNGTYAGFKIEDQALEDDVPSDLVSLHNCDLIVAPP